MKASSVITIFAFCLSITVTTSPKGAENCTASVTTSPKGAENYTGSVTTSPKGAENDTGSGTTNPEGPENKTESVTTSPKGAENYTGSGDTTTTSSIGTPKSTTAAGSTMAASAPHTVNTTATAVTTDHKGAENYTGSVTTDHKGAENYTESVTTSPKGAGNDTGSGDTNTTSSIGTPKSTTAADTQQNGDADHAALLNSKDKNSLWALLLVIPGAAGIYYVGSKLCKSRSHPGDTTDNGMENASFQSRPESIKDGVMLLGVKTSGTDDGAAARS